MTAGRAAAVLWAALLCAPASGRCAWGKQTELLKRIQQEFAAGRYESVLAELTPETMQKLGGESLRRATVYRGASYEHTGRMDKAMGVYQLGTRLFPKNQQLLGLQAHLLHIAGLEEQAQPLYEKILKVDPENAQAHLGLAQIDRALGFLSRSAEHYDRTLNEFGRQPSVWREYAEVLYEARDYRGAEVAIRKALDLSRDEESSLDLAFILCAQGDFPGAIGALEPLVSAGRTEAAQAKALILLEAGRHPEAGAMAEDMLRKEPAHPLAHYVQARVHLQAGRKAQARTELRLAANLGKQAPFTARVCEELAVLLESEP